MNYKLILEHLGLTENIDFSLSGESFEMLPKTRLVSQIIHHEAVPAVFDAQGVETSPEIPAHDEEIQVEESYIPEAPSQEALEQAHLEVELQGADIALLVNEYLADKAELRDLENDSINISEGRIVRWDFANIPQPTLAQLLACKAPAISKAAQAEINAAARKYLAESDYKVLRHIRQKALNQSLSLSEEEYLALELSRAEAAAGIIND
jgi:hypothetical protein